MSDTSAHGHNMEAFLPTTGCFHTSCTSKASILRFLLVMIHHSLASYNTLTIPGYPKICFFVRIYGSLWKDNGSKQFLFRTRLGSSALD